MLTLEENELLTRTGPGTPMGELMRRYWLPAVLSWELPEPDCPPVRVKLLGEAMVMFRDTQNRIGLLDEFCAHRGTSLWLGRNEQSGACCIERYLLFAHPSGHAFFGAENDADAVAVFIHTRLKGTQAVRKSGRLFFPRFPFRIKAAA